MSTCERCKQSYPDELLQPMFIGGEGYTKPICAICALELGNELHGIKRKKFQGEMAEDLRQRALAWRRKHGVQ